MSTRSNAKARGRSYEKRLAEMGDGTIWPGADGDVDIHGHRVEAKYRSNLDGLKLLASFIEQAQANGKSAGKPWALALTGGKTYQNGQTFVVVPWEDWDSTQRQLDQIEAFTKALRGANLNDDIELAAATLRGVAMSLAKEYMDADSLPDGE
jgi:hypothetical protein